MSAVDAERKEGTGQNVETQPVTKRFKAPNPRFQAPQKLQAPIPYLVFQELLRTWFRSSLDPLLRFGIGIPPHSGPLPWGEGEGQGEGKRHFESHQVSPIRRDCSILSRWCLGILWSLELGPWSLLDGGGKGRGLMECWPHLQRGRNPLFRHALAQPIEVAFVALDDGQHEELRRVVRMVGNDELLQRLELRFCRFENDQYLIGRLDFSLPPVVRFDLKNPIGTGDEAGLQCGFRQSARCVKVWCCNQDQNRIPGWLHCFSNGRKAGRVLGCRPIGSQVILHPILSQFRA